MILTDLIMMIILKYLQSVHYQLKHVSVRMTKK